MTDQKYVLCMWKKRLWPAEVLCKTGVAEGTSVADDEKAFFKVEILGVKEQICVSCADAVPLKEECIENIASNLDQNLESGAVEELQYRCSLKIALDILSQNAPSTQVPPSEEEPRTQLPQNDTGSLSSAPLRCCRVPFRSKEKLELETSKRKRGKKSNQRLKVETKKQTQKGSLILEESPKAHGSGTDLSECGTGDLCDTSDSNSQNCKTPGSKSLPRQKKIKPKLLTESKPGNNISLRPRERTALSAPCKPNTVVPGRRANSRAQPRRRLDSSYKSASGDLERSISGVSRSLTKQVDGRRRSASLKEVNGEQEGSVTECSCRRKRHKNSPGSSSGLSKKLMLPDSFPSQEKKEEKEETSCVAMSKANNFPDFEEDEGLESPNSSSKRVSLETLSHLSALINEEEEDEELPSILSYQEPQSIEEGILVWCKLRRYPYWPAVVKYVKHKTRKACVLLIDRNIDDKKSGFSVSLRNLKHFDCEERQDLIERAKEDYRQEIEWCIRLICDYRVRVGCRSFTGSFLEYFAADISYPVRKEGYPGVVQVTFPNVAEEDVQESASETSPQKPSKKLLPDRTRAARDNANKKIVDFIVKTKGAEEHLLSILKSRKESQWLKRFLNSSQYLTCIETYLEDEEQLDLVVNYLKEVYHRKGTKHLRHGDEIKFISDVLLPEAIIYAISAVDNIDYKKAEEKYIKGPSVSKREREIFDERIRERKKCKTKAAPAESV